jgi:hypothetical protein
MKNSATVTCHMHEPDRVQVAPLYPDQLGRDEIWISCGAFSIVANPEAATELTRQLAAHLAGLARRDKEASA